MNQFSISYLAVGEPEVMTYNHNKQMKTAIRKKQTQSVMLRKSGFEGDKVADLKNHGGEERAVCFYPHEHYEDWNEEFNTTLSDSAFGENLVVKGMLEKDVCIGDVYQIGEAVVTITQGRVPCITIDRRTESKGLFKRIMETGYTGYFAKVLKEGIIRGDSSITLVERDPRQMSVHTANQLFFQQVKDPSQIDQLLEVDALAAQWRGHFIRLKDKM
ncbi:MOSC domain-containing protein [Alkalicoccobacillus murimartini]|uniref:MOSC domain-containing protein YiiM n=1 Tax=Alkalicoccobacillus murimartini TaxID=171685 RepID=A0ABT9YEH1_9BACI|nr:MOSC domain-containing protein [Alkalicoccobacillus murimartini]MDQ0206126.1 MOSC domain-containing protein YiiM [Alkalicoccobacillus murimartini]